jgi:hypothetical protein
MDGLCERGGVDVEFVERDDVFLVVRSRGLDLVKDFWEGVRDRRWHGWVEGVVVTWIAAAVTNVRRVAHD